MTLHAVHDAELPTATRTRWQPLRCGVVDLFYYDRQEFWFRDGRLLLRGNNGTGKSKILALTLPFLLDGDLSPSRVEPDGDRGKRMEWNLLLGGRYDERLGYAWLEFGRVHDDGEPSYVTVGCGLKAVHGRGIADHWFFVTSQRVGLDLSLVGPTGAALTRDRLVEAIDGHGQVHRQAGQHRRTVDEQLFRLGADRYDALVNLLIQLRQPQLSKRPDAERLSRALTEALAPIDQAVLADIAAAFHDLEQQRDELDGLRDTRRQVSLFLDRYRRYARVAARRQAAELRTANSRYEDVNRQLGTVRSRIDGARDAADAAARELTETTGAVRRTRAEHDELARRPELKSLDDANRYARSTGDTAAKARARAEAAERQRDDRRDRHADAVVAAELTRADVTGEHDALTEHAQAAGITAEHEDAVRPLRLPDGPDGGLTGDLLGVADRALADAAGRRAEAVRHLTELADAADECREQVTRARRALGDREAERDAAAEAHDGAATTVRDEASALAAAWQRYTADVAELRLPDAEEIALALWTETLDGESPLTRAVRTAVASGERALAALHAAAARRRGDVAAELSALREERARLEGGDVAHPPAAYTRDPAARADRPGAPLWQVVDFADDASPETRVGLEAALEAAGVLDAWCTPYGELLDAGTDDVVVTAGPPVESSLTALLRPAVDAADPRAAALTTDVVASVLAGIGLGESDAATWVDVDGRFRVGALRGEWRKPAAEYVGAGAREAARRRRLAELAELIDTAEAALAEAERAVEAVETRQTALAAEAERQPSDQTLRQAHAAVTSTVRDLRRAEERVTGAREAVDAAECDADQASQARDEAAADLRLPVERAAIAAIAEAVRAYRDAAIRLLAAARVHARQLTDVATWAGELAAAESALAAATADAADVAAEAGAARARLDALTLSIGATVEQLTARLDAAARRVEELEEATEQLRGRREDAVKALANAEGREAQLADDLRDEVTRRDAAVVAFQRYASTGLLPVAVPDLDVPPLDDPWAADPSVRLARRIEQTLTDVDSGDDVWERLRDDVTRRFQDLNDALTRYGHHAFAGLSDWFVVTIEFQGRERRPDELVELLDGEVEYRERMLSAKERELLEEHLVGDVASHLQELISESEAQVAQMNAELEERPTSTGMRVRLRWVPRADGPSGLAEARRRLLRQDADMWSPDDRKAVGDFLQQRIEEVRAEDEQGTWQEQLRRALDYRAWHHFVVERMQDGRWLPATAPASGGERALTVSLPLFAAASAHYRSAHPHAPRLVLLDEAFAGVDDDARAKCLGLLATFDLDVMMTSEREWGFYATVPGIATHQLVRRDGVDAVHVTTWEWDGVAPRQVDRDASGVVRPEHPADDEGGLW